MGKIYLIYGSDEQAVKKRSAALAAEIIDNSNGQCDLETVSGDGSRYEEIMQEFINDLRTPPFLTPEKLIHLRYFIYADKLLNSNDEAASAALELLPAPDDGVHVIIECTQNPPDMRKSNAKKLKSIAEVIVCDAIKSTDKNFASIRSAEIKEYLQSQNKTIAPDALKFLVDTLGSSSGILNNELEKICTYMGDDTKITLDICRMLCARTPESVIYFFTGALLEKDLRAALSTLSDLIQSGEAEVRIMASVSNSISDLVKSLNAMAELNIDPNRVHPGTFNSIPADLKERFPNNPLLKMHPFRAFKVCENAAAWSTEKLGKALKIAADTNLALVSGNGNQRMQLEQMVLKICTL